jgi:LysR family transcriptional regulator, transcriptional activator of nhaA
MSDGSLDWLNYQHLFYFWHVAREGSIARACDKLHLTQPTISIQIQKLERALEAKLFTRTGRRLVLTETGQMVYRYAEEIFALGRELTDAVKDRRADRPLRLTVGVPDVLPKLAVYGLLRPALEMNEEVRLVVHEGKLDQLLADLALHHLDVVLADAPCTAATRIRAFNHLLGDCGVTVFGTKDLARQYAPDFPASLEGAPMLLPTENTSMRRSLEQWFYEQKIHPRITHEVEGQRAAEGVRAGGTRDLLCADSRGGGSSKPIRRAGGRTARRGPGAILRHLGRTAFETPGRARHLTRRAPGTLRPVALN